MKPFKAFIRALIWPIRRFFDPRFQGIAQQGQVLREDVSRRFDLAAEQSRAILAAAEQSRATLAEVAGRSEELAGRSEELTGRSEELRASQVEIRAMLAAEMEGSSEATTVLGRSLSDLLGEADRLRELILAAQGDAITESYVERIVDSGPDVLDERLAKILNFATSHRGFAAQRNLWFNPPLVIEHDDGDVRVSVVNERVAESPYVMRAIGRLPPGATILDVGAAENTLSFSLATLGYQVTALDLHPYPLEHPNLQSVEAAVQNWKTNAAFDAVICLSSIEHIGLGVYGEAKLDEGADLAAMNRIGELTKPGGLLVLTAPFGEKGRNEVQRTYDRAALDELLDGWEIEDLTILSRVDPTTWQIADSTTLNSGDNVVLVTARRP
jgi:SAM-dependent methyltransferase